MARRERGGHGRSLLGARPCDDRAVHEPELPAFPADRPWVRAVMASTLDGVMRGPDGSSRSISTPADQRWFSRLRKQPDVLLVGAQTIRSEDYRPSQKVVAVVSRSLDLPPTLRMFAERTDAHPRPIVLTTDAAALDAPAHLREQTDVVGCGDDHVDLARAVGALVERGLPRIQCEGGPRLLGDLVAADLLDELLLTLTPSLLGGGQGEHILHVPGGLDRRGRIVRTQDDEGTLLLQVAMR